MAKRKKTGWQRADRHLAELTKDPQFQKKEQGREKRLAALEAMRARNERPLVRELRRIGLEVNSVYDLVNAKKSYPEAIPVLIKHLERPSYDTAIREGIVRALTVKEARGVAEEPLLRAFREAPMTTSREKALKWAIGNALGFVATEPYKDEILALLSEKKHGEARSQLARALARFKDPRLDNVLIELTQDNEKGVVIQSTWALGKRKSTSAIPRLKEISSHSDKDIQRAAKTALAKTARFLEKTRRRSR
jgi:HEAT repeat protein